MPKSFKKPTVIPLIFDTYLAIIKNSLGSIMFRNFYAKVDGKKTDIMRNGELSCALYVSSLLVLFKFIGKVHGTVDSTVKDMKESGWKEIKKPKIGSVIVWESMDFGDNDIHKHIGFFVDGDKAISNSYRLGYPVEHSWDFDSQRKVEIILWNPMLKN
ncbi:MAG: hypothetical protein AAB870_03560 [Patescibacteria group bacterium]